MRLLAFFALLLALAATGWAGQSFWQEWRVQDAPVAPRRAALQPSETAAPAPTPSVRSWPALFGEPQPPAPPKPPAPQPKEEPQPPPRQYPPLDSMGYVLTGVVQVNGTVWATVSHPSGQQLLRKGDILRDDLRITRIDERGLWAAPEGGQEMLLAFPE